MNNQKTNGGASAKNEKTEKPSGKVFNVRAVGVPRRCRAGMCFDEAGTNVDFAVLDKNQILALTADPHLKVDTAKAMAEALDIQEANQA